MVSRIFSLVVVCARFKGKMGENGEKDRERHHLRARIHDCGAEYLFARESATAVLSTFGSAI